MVRRVPVADASRRGVCAMCNLNRLALSQVWGGKQSQSLPQSLSASQSVPPRPATVCAMLRLAHLHQQRLPARTHTQPPPHGAGLKFSACSTCPGAQRGAGRVTRRQCYDWSLVFSTYCEGVVGLEGAEGAKGVVWGRIWGVVSATIRRSTLSVAPTTNCTTLYLRNLPITALNMCSVIFCKFIWNIFNV